MENEINRRNLNINAVSFVPRNIDNSQLLMNRNRNPTDVGLNMNNSNNVASTNSNAINTNSNTNSNSSGGNNLDAWSSSTINYPHNRQDIQYHPSTLAAGHSAASNNSDIYSQFSNMMISPSSPASPYDVAETQQHLQQQALMQQYYIYVASQQQQHQQQQQQQHQQSNSPYNNIVQLFHQQQQMPSQQKQSGTVNASKLPILSNRIYGHTTNMNLPHHTIGSGTAGGLSGPANLSNMTDMTNTSHQHHHQSSQPFHQISGAMTAGPGSAVAGNAGSGNIPSPADRARRNSCLTVKTFNTGNDDINTRLTHLYKEVNPRSEFSMDLRNARFFVIKSYTEDHVHRSIKYGEWCSTQKGNEILDNAYRSVTTPPAGMANTSSYKPGTVLLFFSVNGSGYFCGVAEMTSRFDPTRRGAHWTNDSMLPGGGSRWSGGFDVHWRYVKDVPNKYLKHIILEFNDNRPVTNSRDATEIKPREKGIETLRIIHEYHNNSSLFDDFDYYETREQLHNSSSSTNTAAVVGSTDVMGSVSHR